MNFVLDVLVELVINWDKRVKDFVVEYIVGWCFYVFYILVDDKLEIRWICLYVMWLVLWLRWWLCVVFVFL